MRSSRHVSTDTPSWIDRLIPRKAFAVRSCLELPFWYPPNPAILEIRSFVIGSRWGGTGPELRPVETTQRYKPGSWRFSPHNGERRWHLFLTLLGQPCVTEVAHILLTRSTTPADRRGRLREQDMIPTNTSKVFAAGLLIATLSSRAAAAPPRTRTLTDEYSAQYDERRHVYCIKFFAELPAAMPQPGPSRDICKSQAAWAKEGIRVSRGGRFKPF
jgi:hypothetical protein